MRRASQFKAMSCLLSSIRESVVSSSRFQITFDSRLLIQAMSGVPVEKACGGELLALRRQC